MPALPNVPPRRRGRISIGAHVELLAAILVVLLVVALVNIVWIHHHQIVIQPRTIPGSNIVGLGATGGGGKTRELATGSGAGSPRSRDTKIIAAEAEDIGANVEERRFHYVSAPEGVDVLYLWTNGTDPIRRRQLEEHEGEATIKNAHSANRWRDRGELYYSLILLYKHVSNLRNVVVVSGGERAWYADQFPQVAWVNDTEFVPADVLPTFSSTTIEFGLYHLLPRLSDPFIEMNDDWFIRKPLDLREYCQRRVWYEDNWVVHSPKNHGEFDAHLNSFLNSNEAIAKIFPQHKPRNLIAHVPTVVRHNTLAFIFDKMKESVSHSITRFRSEKSLQFQYMLANVERYRNQSDVQFSKGDAVLYFAANKRTPEEVRVACLKILRDARPFLCLNDDITDPQPVHGEILKHFFEALVGWDVEKHTLALEKLSQGKAAKKPKTDSASLEPSCIGSSIELGIQAGAREIPVKLQKLLSEVQPEQRKYFLHNPDKKSPEDLTAMISAINTVDVDNSLSVGVPAPKAGDVVKVAELNAERGRYWCEFARQIKETPELAAIDIWLLNEFDLGMARSEQLHTIRHFAYSLGMNYAWGVEFVELTNGNKEEQGRTKDEENNHGLHGNAILSRWPLENPKIVRMPGMGPLYNSSGFATAGGFERRLGSRMTLFSSVVLEDGKELVLGATHAQTSWRNNVAHVNESIRRMKEYISSRRAAAVLLAGDTWPKTCSLLGLGGVSNMIQPFSKIVNGKVVARGSGADDYICGRGCKREGSVKTIAGIGRQKGFGEFILADHVIVATEVKLDY